MQTSASRAYGRMKRHASSASSSGASEPMCERHATRAPLSRSSPSSPARNGPRAIGSVSRRVVHRAESSVLLIPPDDR
jgi:hypothetical protein